MEEICNIEGFLHYRNDIGDGTRTGVVFSQCYGTCKKICSPYPLLSDHFYAEETPERSFFTAAELGEYLRQEKVYCYSKNVGITLMGGEPLLSLEYCQNLLKILKGYKINVHLWTCGNLDFHIYHSVRDLVDLFVIQLVCPLQGVHNPYPGYQAKKVMETIQRMDVKKIPYRVRIPVIRSVNTEIPDFFAEYLKDLSHLKSVILDFSDSGLSKEKELEYRQAFLKRGVVLY